MATGSSWAARRSWPSGASALNGSLGAELESAEAAGRTVVTAAWDGRVRALLVVADTVKPSSAEAFRNLRALGLRPILLTGDNAVHRPRGRGRGRHRRGDLRGAALPEGGGRSRASGGGTRGGDGGRRRQRRARALAQADLGLAIGTGTDVAIEASDLTLVSGDLRSAADAIRLSRRTLRTIKGNLFWAFAYNVAALPLAALGYLNPLVAGVAMALSSVFVVSNSLRLRRFRARRS